MKRATTTLERRGVTIRADFLNWSYGPRHVCRVRLTIEGKTKKTIRDATLCLMHGPIGDEPSFAVYTIRPRLPSRWQRQGIDAAWRVALEQKTAEEKEASERGEQFVEAVCGPSSWEGA